MPLTDEQAHIVDHEGDLKIEAVAGSGKTSTLIEYARLRPKANLLYLAFNRTVRDTAAQRFQELGLRNIQVETAHSLAFKHVKRQRKFEVGHDLKVADLAQLLGFYQKAKDRQTALTLAAHVLQCAQYFCNSEAEKIEQCQYNQIISEAEARQFAEQHLEHIYKYTRLLLKKMYDGEIPYSHDFYLKLFHRLQPQLDQYQYLLFDEGQDASAVMLNVFLKQKGHKIIVGDTHQQIYGWRYAVNSLQTVPFPTLSLTGSFRFDQYIADFANNILAMKMQMGLPKALQLRGLRPLGKKAVVQEYALLARSNMGLLEMVIDQLADDPDTSIYFEGGLNNYTFSGGDSQASIYDIISLYEGKSTKIKSELVRTFPSIIELEQYATEIRDNDLRLGIRLVKKYKKDLSGFLKQVNSAQVKERKQARFIASTVHRAKGMEYDHVELGADFIDEDKLKVLIIDGHQQKLPQDWRTTVAEEINILYVGATRTKYRITIQQELKSLLPELPSVKSKGGKS
jgi:F-box protein, helicase, 18